MTELADFLRARLLERRAVAEAASNLQDDPEHGWGISDSGGEYAPTEKRRWITPHIGVLYEPESADHVVANNPAVILADIDAKVAIVDAYVSAEKILDAWACPDDRDIGRSDGIEEAIRYLALPFAEHPGYKEDWRP